jgi:hypothetical protein
MGFGMVSIDVPFAWRGVANIAAVFCAALALSPVAAADAPGCLPLNGVQLNANSHEDTNYFGVIYDSNVTYWYQDGAVNWHKTLDGGEFNLTHQNTTGTVPAAPGGTATIPGTGGRNASPIIVTVCTK